MLSGVLNSNLVKLRYFLALTHVLSVVAAIELMSHMKQTETYNIDIPKQSVGHIIHMCALQRF